MRGRVAPFVLPTLVHARRQNANASQMLSSQERWMREQKQMIKKENDTRSPKLEAEPQTKGDIYEN